MSRKELDLVMMSVTSITFHSWYIILLLTVMAGLQNEGAFDYIGLAVMDSGPRYAIISIIFAAFALMLSYALIFKVVKGLYTLAHSCGEISKTGDC